MLGWSGKAEEVRWWMSKVPESAERRARMKAFASYALMASLLAGMSWVAMRAPWVVGGWMLSTLLVAGVSLTWFINNQVPWREMGLFAVVFLGFVALTHHLTASSGNVLWEGLGHFALDLVILGGFRHRWMRKGYVPSWAGE